MYRIKHCANFAEELEDPVRILKRECHGQIKTKDNFVISPWTMTRKRFVWRLGKQKMQLKCLGNSELGSYLKKRGGQKRRDAEEMVKEKKRVVVHDFLLSLKFERPKCDILASSFGQDPTSAGQWFWLDTVEWYRSPHIPFCLQWDSDCPGKTFHLSYPDGEETLDPVTETKKKRLGQGTERMSLWHISSSQAFVKWLNKIGVFWKVGLNRNYYPEYIEKPDKNIEAPV